MEYILRVIGRPEIERKKWKKKERKFVRGRGRIGVRDSYPFFILKCMYHKDLCYCLSEEIKIISEKKIT